MKDWTKFLEEDPKKQKAAAYEMDSENKMSPPDFNVTSQNSESSQPIQGMFASSQLMGIGSAADAAKTLSSTKLAASPAPFWMGSSNTDKKTNPGGLINSLSPELTNLSKGLHNIASTATGKIAGATKAFSGNPSDYIDAVTFGKSMFKLQAKFKDLTIMGLSAIGTPGCLDGPNMENLINMAPSVLAMQGEEKAMKNAVAKGVGKNFDQWRKQVTVPGLPWYPAFVAWPGPMAPPMPNVPMPLSTCVSSKLSKIVVGSQLKKAIYGNLPSDMKNSANEAFVQALADNLAMHFLIWISSQMVTNVLGKGPVPTFAPPFVPVGPVIGGDNIPVPGNLMS